MKVRTSITLGAVALAWPIAPALAAPWTATPRTVHGSYVAVPIEGMHQVHSLGDAGQVAGQVSGALTDDNRFHAALWDNGVITDLGMVGCREGQSHCSSVATAANVDGVVVGASHVANSMPSPYGQPWAIYHHHETKWVNNSPMLVQAIGHEWGYLMDINSSGNMVGYGRSTRSDLLQDYTEHGYVIIGSTEHIIGGQNQHSRALSINDRNQATGYVEISGKRRAFLWDNGVVAELGTLGGAASEGLHIEVASAIAEGMVGTATAPTVVVGWSNTEAGTRHAFLWRSDTGEMSDLGALPESTESTATASNAQGLVVGESGGRAVLWRGAAVYDLNDVVEGHSSLLERAVDINNAGQILVDAAVGFYRLDPVHDRFQSGTPTDGR